MQERYEIKETQPSFCAENEKMAVRAFKEGLNPPLKFRVINSPENTFEKIRQFALEEEPYANKNRQEGMATHNFGQQNERRPQIFPQEWGNKPRPRNPINRNFNQQYGQNHWQQNQYQGFPGEWSPGANHPPISQNIRETYSNNAQQRNWNNINNRISFKANPTAFCYRCGKKGHFQETCFVNLNRQNNTSNQQQTSQPKQTEEPTKKPNNGRGIRQPRPDECSIRIDIFSTNKLPQRLTRNNSSLINLYCSVGIVNSLTLFLVDTGADVSMIKQSALRPNIYIYRKGTSNET